jgi:hypothetical protein
MKNRISKGEPVQSVHGNAALRMVSRKYRNASGSIAFKQPLVKE